MSDAKDNAATGLDHFKKTYFEECAERLDAAYAHLGALAEGHADDETMHAIFRAVHSIKGGAGAFGFDRLVAFAHELETLLDLLRSGSLAVAPDIVALLLRATDALSDLIDAARSGEDVAGGFEDELTNALHKMAEGGGAARSATASRPQAPEQDTDGSTTHRYRIRFVPRTEMFQRANEPLLVFRALKRLGPVQIEADFTRLPDLIALEPEYSYLGWQVELRTSASRSAVDEVFEFVVDDCDLSIEVDNVAAATASPIAPAPSARSVVDGLRTPRGAEPGAAKPDDARAETAGAAHSIRVDVEKVDRVVNLVGELVINQAMLRQLGSDLPTDFCPGLMNGLETLSQHLRELQESVMAIRAQPVKSVFSRMPRLVREVASHLGKEVRLVVSGEGTEIDKTVIEQLADPLTHLLRNAVDHGIELPDEREARGKPRHGTIHLCAEHRSGRIVIEIADDGRGIDRDKLLAKAQERGLVQPDASLRHDEIDNLIFLPGLSTADSVSSISGRGVGMDVVKRNMQALGGRIAVESSAGSGSRFLLSLPLTLAVLDGMVVAVGGETYIIPLTNIVESLRPKPADIHPVVGRGDVLSLRGVYVPLVYLHRHFDASGAVTDACRGTVVIVEGEGEGRIGLVVDELLGQQQVVIKSLETNYEPVGGIGGATILGNGMVALILDIGGLRGVASPVVPKPLERSSTTAESSRMSSVH
ncbi:MAG: chemotaxis protein CheA [Stellaceae bacterium]